MWRVIWLFLMVVSDASAQQVSCDSLLKEVDTLERRYALNKYLTMGDNSAVRETNRLIEGANLLALMSMNVQLAASAKCKLPVSPVGAGGYELWAIHCNNMAMASAPSRSGPLPEECKYSEWVRGAVPLLKNKQ